MTLSRILLSGVLLLIVAIPILVGCNVLQYQFCISNFTPFNLNEVDIVSQGASSWGTNSLASFIPPGGEKDIKGFAPGTYMVRAVFDVADTSGLCGPIINGLYIVTNNDLTITTTNICIDYDEQQTANTDKVPATCTEIYGSAHFEI